LCKKYARSIPVFIDAHWKIFGSSALKHNNDMSGAAFRTESGATTHVGKVRRQNEDSYLVSEPSGIWAVADGMGGHTAGDLASQTVVAELQRIAPPSSAAELLSNCEARLVDANSYLKKLADTRGGNIIGTTVAVLLVYADVFACVWSGDSRIYRIRNGVIEQLSVDHTDVQELVAGGQLTAAEARVWPHRNVITRAIGADERPELEITNGVVEPGDIFLICSDGLTTHVEDQEIFACAAENPPQKACEQLVELTLDRGATDNVTVVVTRFDRATPTSQTGIRG
jgi:serine/threonine protein phosphatase PrpC